MKKSLTILVVASALLAGALQLSAVAAEKTTLMGEVIDVTSYAMMDARGEEGATAGQFRAGLGFPIGILDQSGEVFIAVYKNPAPASGLESANKILAPLMGKEVVIRGQLYRAQGVNLIQIAIVSEM